MGYIKYHKMSIWAKKICSKCGLEKYVIEFPANTRRNDGSSNWCRDCHRLYKIKKNNHN